MLGQKFPVRYGYRGVAWVGLGCCRLVGLCSTQHQHHQRENLQSDDKQGSEEYFFVLLPYSDHFTFCLPSIPVRHHVEEFSAAVGAL